MDVVIPVRRPHAILGLGPGWPGKHRGLERQTENRAKLAQHARRVEQQFARIQHPYRFEFPADHVVFPRLDHQTVAFVYHTWCHDDGLLIYVPENYKNTGPIVVSG